MGVGCVGGREVWAMMVAVMATVMVTVMLTVMVVVKWRQ